MEELERLLGEVKVAQARLFELRDRVGFAAHELSKDKDKANAHYAARMLARALQVADLAIYWSMNDVTDMLKKGVK